MKQRRHTPEQVVRKLREGNRMLAEGKTLPEVAKALEVSENTGRQQGGGDRRAQGDREGKLVSPSRRRAAVLMLKDRLDVSERRACQIAAQHRSTQRPEPLRAADDAALRAALRKISEERPRWGYRRLHRLLRREGWTLNRKVTQRVYREEGLHVQRRKRKRVAVLRTQARRTDASERALRGAVATLFQYPSRRTSSRRSRAKK